MSFFKKLFGGGAPEETVVRSSAPGVPNTESGKTQTFGRYTDCNKNGAQLDDWNKALKAFADKNYVDSFAYFLNYVRDPELDNVKIVRNADSVDFELIQGSKRIVGSGNAKDFVATASIAEMPVQNIPVMRKLMALNFGLRYSKFASKDGILCMKFSSHAIDASPNKLYAGLAELAKKSDQQDDLLLSEFSVLKSTDTDHIIEPNAAMQEAKFQYLVGMVESTKAEVAKLDAQKMAGGIAFLLLDLTYKIDYLICPQGDLTNSLEKIQTEFFKQGNATTAERNTLILSEFDELMAQPKEKIMEGLYDVVCTFGIANPGAHKTVMDMMFKEREKVAWYRDNGYPRIVESVYGYMISYAFFNYGMVYPVSRILNIAMHVLNPDYYKKMGDTNNFVGAGNALNGNAISKAISGIIADAKKDYPFIQFNTATLRFTSPADFIDSLILTLDKVDLRKK